MAFPVIQGTRNASVSSTTDATSFTPALPTGIVAGELLLAIVTSDGAPTLSTTSTGWNKVSQASNGSIVTQAIFWKIATGSDTLVVASTAAEQFSAITMRISGFNTTTPLYAANANGSSTNSNPPALAPGIGAQDFLWIATRGGDSTVVATAAPTNYANLTSRAGGGTAGASTNIADRSLNAASEDPGTFTSANEQWVTYTIAINPVAAPLNQYTGSGSGNAKAPNGSGIGKINKANDSWVRFNGNWLDDFAWTDGLGSWGFRVRIKPVTINEFDLTNYAAGAGNLTTFMQASGTAFEHWLTNYAGGPSYSTPYTVTVGTEYLIEVYYDANKQIDGTKSYQFKINGVEVTSRTDNVASNFPLGPTRGILGSAAGWQWNADVHSVEVWRNGSSLLSVIDQPAAVWNGLAQMNGPAVTQTSGGAATVKSGTGSGQAPKPTVSGASGAIVAAAPNLFDSLNFDLGSNDGTGVYTYDQGTDTLTLQGTGLSTGAYGRVAVQTVNGETYTWSGTLSGQTMNWRVGTTAGGSDIQVSTTMQVGANGGSWVGNGAVNYLMFNRQSATGTAVMSGMRLTGAQAATVHSGTGSGQAPKPTVTGATGAKTGRSGAAVTVNAPKPTVTGATGVKAGRAGSSAVLNAPKPTVTGASGSLVRVGAAVTRNAPKPTATGTGAIAVTPPSWTDIAATNNQALPAPYTSPNFLWGYDWRANVAQTSTDLMRLDTDPAVIKFLSEFGVVRSGDPSDRYRSEVSGSQFPWSAASGDRWFSWETVNLQLPNNVNWVTLMQQFDNGFVNPSFKLEHRPGVGGTEINIAGDTGTTRNQTAAWQGSAFDLAKRYRHVFRIRAHPTNGEADWWLNGTHIMALRGVPIGSGTTPTAYEKIGVYTDDDATLTGPATSEVIVYNYESASGTDALRSRIASPLAAPAVMSNNYPLGPLITGTQLVGGNAPAPGVHSGSGSPAAPKPTISAATGVKTNRSALPVTLSAPKPNATGASGAKSLIGAAVTRSAPKPTASGATGRKTLTAAAVTRSAPKPTAAGSGGLFSPRTGSATVTAPKPAAAGQGGLHRNGTGAGTAPKPSAAGSGARGVSGAAVTRSAPRPTVTGASGSLMDYGTGAANGPKPTASGTGIIQNVPRVGSGSVSAPKATVSGSGARGFRAAGVTVFGPKPNATGSGRILQTKSGSGAVTGAKPTASGIGSIPRGAEGSVTGVKPNATGTGAILHSGSGAVTAPKAAVSGNGLKTGRAGSGAITAPKATVTGSGIVNGAGSGMGAVNAPRPVAANASGAIQHVGTGAASARRPTATGAGRKGLVGSGAVSPRPATVTATGARLIGGLGAATARGPAATGAGSRQISGAGVVVAPVPQGTGNNIPRTPRPAFAIEGESRLAVLATEPRTVTVAPRSRVAKVNATSRLARLRRNAGISDN